MFSHTRITKVLDDYNASWVIGGGYPRDIRHNKPPKDMDIIVVCPTLSCVSLMEHLIDNQICDQFFFDTDSYEFSEELMEENYVGDPLILCVAKDTKEKIDVIFYNPDYFVDATDAVEKGMDYNINQYILEDGSGVFVGENEGKLELVAADIKEGRREYINQKAKEYGWDEED